MPDKCECIGSKCGENKEIDSINLFSAFIDKGDSRSKAWYIQHDKKDKGNSGFCVDTSP